MYINQDPLRQQLCHAQNSRQSPHSILFFRKQRKRSDVSRSSADKTVLKSDSSSQIERLSPSSHGHDYHSDQETVTTAEPQSDSEEFIDDHLSDSMLSSVGAAAELDEVRSDSKRVLTTPLELLVEDDDDDVLKGTV